MSEPVIVEGFVPPKIIGRGRRPGFGPNQKLLARIKPGELSSCIWGLTEGRMRSIKSSASLLHMSLRIRKLEHNLYAVWRLT